MNEEPTRERMEEHVTGIKKNERMNEKTSMWKDRRIKERKNGRTKYLKKGRRNE